MKKRLNALSIIILTVSWKIRKKTLSKWGKADFYCMVIYFSKRAQNTNWSEIINYVLAISSFVNWRYRCNFYRIWKYPTWKTNIYRIWERFQKKIVIFLVSLFYRSSFICDGFTELFWMEVSLDFCLILAMLTWFSESSIMRSIVALYSIYYFPEEYYKFLPL